MSKTIALDLDNTEQQVLEEMIKTPNAEFKENVVWENNAVKIVELEVEKDCKWIGTRYKNDNVAILPYTTTEFGLIENIGLLYEFNAFRDDKYSWTLVTGGEDDSDETHLNTAQREFQEESGFLVEDADLWTYLGTVTTSKMIDYAHPCYAVNVTGIEKGKEDKKSTAEKLSRFEFKPLSFAIRQNDAFILSAIMKFYIINYTQTFKIKEKDGQ